MYGERSRLKSLAWGTTTTKTRKMRVLTVPPRCLGRPILQRCRVIGRKPQRSQFRWNALERGNQICPFEGRPTLGIDRDMERQKLHPRERRGFSGWVD